DGGNSDLGQPDRLSARHEGRRTRLDAARTTDVSLAPPAPQVLGPEDPGLAIGAVRDRKARLRRPARLVGIVPVIGLAGGEALTQMDEIGRATRNGGIGMAAGIAPVRKRRI